MKAKIGEAECYMLQPCLLDRPGSSIAIELIERCLHRVIPAYRWQKMIINNALTACVHIVRSGK